MKSFLILLACLALPSARAASASSAVVDSGTFRISLQGKVLGTEQYVHEAYGDSLIISSFVQELIPNQDTGDTLHKSMTLVLKASDFELLNYQSTQRFLGQRLHRSLVIHDTTYVAYFQVNEQGEGDVRVRPPGRLFVLDPQIFTLYDVICRNLHGRTFERRELQILALGAPDTTLLATATDLGKETIRWGARPVLARKIGVRDGRAEFLMWISEDGRMLRLSQPAFQMLVERVGPRIRPAARRPSG